jgi:hypothetical protein
MSNIEYSVPLLEELFKAGSLVLPSLVVLLVASNFELESLTRFAHRHSMTLFAVAKRCTPFRTMELDSRKRGEAAYLKAKCLSPEVIDVLARPAQPLKNRRLDQSDDKTFT